jgi:ATP-dependent Clp protease ATP-binding subunit ClpC
MEFANDEAIRLKHEYLGTEHILLALIKEGHGVAATAIQNLGVDMQKVRNAIERIQSTGPDDAPRSNHLHTPRARRVLEYAAQEAHALKHNYIGTEHLLLGMLHQPDETAAGMMLSNFGLTLENVRAEIVGLLEIGLDQ